MLVAVVTIRLAAADDTKDQTNKDKSHDRGKIVSIDAKKGSVTISVKNENGQRSAKTFQLASDARFLDDHGQSLQSNSFQAGDRVCIVEKDGKISELKKEPRGCRPRSRKSIPRPAW